MSINNCIHTIRMTTAHSGNINFHTAALKVCDEVDQLRRRVTQLESGKPPSVSMTLEVELRTGNLSDAISELQTRMESCEPAHGLPEEVYGILRRWLADQVGVGKVSS